MLRKVVDEFKLVKRIVEDGKRFSWNSILPHDTILFKMLKHCLVQVFRLQNVF